DYTGPGLGGNKVRKLEYVLAQARAEGAEVVITVGGEKSNHARVTAALAARLGLRCLLVLNTAAVRPAGLKPASLYLDQLFGAEVILVADREERNRMMTEVAAELRREGRRVVEIPLGASVPRGALGFVRAAEEAAAQLAAGGVRPDYLFHCS